MKVFIGNNLYSSIKCGKSCKIKLPSEHFIFFFNFYSYHLNRYSFAYYFHYTVSVKVSIRGCDTVEPLSCNAKHSKNEINVKTVD